MLLKEIEDKMKEEQKEAKPDLLQEEKEKNEEKLEPEDPEQRSIFISNINKKLTEADIVKLCERKILLNQHYSLWQNQRNRADFHRRNWEIKRQR